MRFIQINLRHSKNATSNLSQILLDLNIDCALIQEPYAKLKNNDFDFYDVPLNYVMIHNLTHDHAYGAAIAIKSGYDVRKLDNMNDNHCVGAEINLGTEKVTVVSLYCRPSTQLSEFETTLENLSGACKKTLRHTIIGADLNAKNTIWGSKKTDDRGSTTENWLKTLPIRIANEQISRLNYIPSNYGRIDVTFAGDKTDMKNWEFLDLPSLSDHPLIYFELEHRRVSKQKKNRVPRLDEIDERQFQRRLTEEVAKIVELQAENISLKHKGNVDCAVERITSAFKTSAIMSKKRPVRGKQNKLGWWTDELWEIRSKLRHAQKAFANRQTTENNDRKKALKSEYQRKIRSAKENAFKEMCSTKMNKDLFGALKELAKCRKESQIPPKLSSQAEMITDKGEICKTLLNCFFPKQKATDSAQQDLIELIVSFSNITEQERPPPITITELRDAMNDMNRDSAAGEDGLTTDLVFSGFESVKEELLALYNKCIDLRYFPSSWKKARITVLKKPGKDDYTSVKSFRPISVLNVLGKIFEKIIHKRLVWYAKKDRWLDERQHGFKEGRSTETAALTLVRTIEKNKLKQLCTSVLFLDISAAFDSAWPPAIVHALLKKECPGYLVKIVLSFLLGRECFIEDNVSKYSHKIEIGCPQGSILSPFLWNVLIDGVLRAVEFEGTDVIAFADDLTLLAWDKNPINAVKKLQRISERVIENLRGLMLEVNTSKSSFMMFGTKNEHTLIINDTLLKPVF